MPHKNSSILAILCTALLLLAQGCATPGRLAAVPVQDTTRAEIPGIPHARYWVTSDIEPFIRDALASAQREQAYLARTGHQGPLPPVNFLAISGGGDDGAFGAGLLVGWTASGTRPEFKGVTGVSTGALIAPFAFLGPEEDAALREVYTMIGPQNILKPRGLLAALTDDGLADNSPLFELISRHINAEFLARIAREYQDKGRLLLVGTTDLDARRPVIWNMGEIAMAAQDNPKALDLFRKIMLASAAIPGAFPPVMIDVEVNGKPYQEMHVDGGTPGGNKTPPKGAQRLCHPQCPAGPGLGVGGSQYADHRRARHFVADPDAGGGGSVPDLPDRAKGWSGLQPGVYRRGLQRQAQGRFRHRVHAGAV